MNIRYICPYWGQEGTTPEDFIEKVIAAGYGGIEIHLPDDESFTKDLITQIAEVRKTDPGFVLILQQLEFPDDNDVDQYILKMEYRLMQLADLRPNFINSHTGRDYYSFEDNCRAIDAANRIAAKTGIPIFHETHRGRFSFHAATLIPYLKKYPNMNLTGDFSHFCTVSESMLQNQEEILSQIMPHVAYIHARIGHEQGPQVNDPFAPEWASHLEKFLIWWKQILRYQQASGMQEHLICTEFGPHPYMPSEPYTQRPMSDQWEVNVKMKEWICSELIKESVDPITL